MYVNRTAPRPLRPLAPPPAFVTLNYYHVLVLYLVLEYP